MAPLRETGADFVETPVGLGSWLSAFEASFARTFRTVASGSPPGHRCSVRSSHTANAGAVGGHPTSATSRALAFVPPSLMGLSTRDGFRPPWVTRQAPRRQWPRQFLWAAPRDRLTSSAPHRDDHGQWRRASVCSSTSPNRPGANLTGSAGLAAELAPKRRL
jgi:hypothetical protein